MRENMNNTGSMIIHGLKMIAQPSADGQSIWLEIRRGKELLYMIEEPIESALNGGPAFMRELVRKLCK